MTTSIVAGGMGFIGSHLVDKLLDMGHDVIVLDNCVSGTCDNLVHRFDEREQDEKDKKHVRFHYVPIDLARMEFKTRNKIDYIFNLAAIASPPLYKKYPIDTLMVAARGAECLLEIAAANNCPYIFTSSSEVYGQAQEHPQKENYFGNVNTCGPRSSYDEAKRFGEALCFHYREAKGVQARILRIFNTYGPRMQLEDGRVIPNFIDAGLSSKPMLLKGDGSFTRSFCYVDDTVEALIMAMRVDFDKPINIGNPKETSLRDLAAKIHDTIGVITSEKCSSEVVENGWESDEDDPVIRCPNITRAQKILGWSPRIGLDDGLFRTIGWALQPE